MAKGRTPAEHYDQAQRNEELYNELGGSRSKRPEWAVTVLFYVAVHEVEAMFRKRRWLGSADHYERRQRIQGLSSDLATAYDSLEDMSRQARYECVRHSEARIALAEISLSIVRREIAKLGAGPPY